MTKTYRSILVTFLIVILGSFIGKSAYAFVIPKSGTFTSCTKNNVSGSFTVEVTDQPPLPGAFVGVAAMSTKKGNFPPFTDGSTFVLSALNQQNYEGKAVGTYTVNFGPFNPSSISGYSDHAVYEVNVSSIGQVSSAGVPNTLSITCVLNGSCIDLSTNCGESTYCGADKLCQNYQCVSCTTSKTCADTNACGKGPTCGTTEKCVSGFCQPCSPCSDTSNLCGSSGCGPSGVCISGECKSCTPPNIDQCPNPTGVCGDSATTGCPGAYNKCVRDSGNTYNTCVPCTSAGKVVVKYTGPISNLSDVITQIFNILIPVSVALGLFFIIRAGYILKTSEGNPQKTSQGKEDLTAAIAGTLFVLLSLVILRIIIRVVLGGNPF